jgi:hypothetical protein
MLAGPWRKPWRMPPASPTRVNATVVVLFALAIGIIIGAGLLAQRNLRAGRGDSQGAARLATCMTSVLLALWLCQVHLVASIGLLAMLLIAVCTTVFNGVLLWTIYLALEPFVRRHWPQVLVSGRTLCQGDYEIPSWGVTCFSVRRSGGVGADHSRDRSRVEVAGDLRLPWRDKAAVRARSTAGVVLETAPCHPQCAAIFFHCSCCGCCFAISGRPPSAFAGIFSVLGAGKRESAMGGCDLKLPLFRQRCSRRASLGLLSRGRPLRVVDSDEYHGDARYISLVLREHAASRWARGGPDPVGFYTSVGGRLWAERYPCRRSTNICATVKGIARP